MVEDRIIAATAFNNYIFSGVAVDVNLLVAGCSGSVDCNSACRAGNYVVAIERFNNVVAVVFAGVKSNCINAVSTKQNLRGLPFSLFALSANFVKLTVISRRANGCHLNLETSRNIFQQYSFGRIATECNSVVVVLYAVVANSAKSILNSLKRILSSAVLTACDNDCIECIDTVNDISASSSAEVVNVTNRIFVRANNADCIVALARKDSNIFCLSSRFVNIVEVNQISISAVRN